VILVARKPLDTIDDVYQRLQMALQIEFATLPPYLYSLFSILPDTNPAAVSRIRSVVLEEMIHFCLACNILNALGGTPVVATADVIPTYPGPLPGDLGGLTIHLYPFSCEAMKQGMDIETPEEGPIAVCADAALAEGEKYQTIGQFYSELDAFLSTLPPDAWCVGRNQITDAQFFVGDLFAVNSYADANRAIQIILSEGEGSRLSPLDFREDFAHYYRFKEIYRNQVLTKSVGVQGFVWGEELGVDWSSTYEAISDPATHDFSRDLPVAAAQARCNEAFSKMVIELEQAVQGTPARMGHAVRAMFKLRSAAHQAFLTPLAGTKWVAGPAFVFHPIPTGTVS
jgi:hypothetical protein